MKNGRCINRNLTPITTAMYSPAPNTVLPVQTHKGPLATEYLDGLYRVTQHAIQAYRRVMACRFDLTLPHGKALPDDAYTNAPLKRCLDSFQAKIDHDRQKRQSPHRCKVRYVAAREISEDGMPHFHLLLFFNLHAYNTPGTLDYENGSNLFIKLSEAWASALRLPVEDAVDNVRLCRGRPVEYVDGFTNAPADTLPLLKVRSHYYLEPYDDYGSLAPMFYRGSYLCKLHSKRYGDGHRAFMTSQG